MDLAIRRSPPPLPMAYRFTPMNLAKVGCAVLLPLLWACWLWGTARAAWPPEHAVLCGIYVVGMLAMLCLVRWREPLQAREDWRDACMAVADTGDLTALRRWVRRASWFGPWHRRSLAPLSSFLLEHWFIVLLTIPLDKRIHSLMWQALDVLQDAGVSLDTPVHGYIYAAEYALAPPLLVTVFYESPEEVVELLRRGADPHYGHERGCSLWQTIQEGVEHGRYQHAADTARELRQRLGAQASEQALGAILPPTAGPARRTRL